MLIIQNPSVRERKWALSCLIRPCRLPRAFLARVPSLKDRVQLFKRPSLRLNKEEIDKHHFEEVPEYEEDVAAGCFSVVVSRVQDLTINTYNQYLIFSMATGAAKVLTKLAQPAVIWKSIIPFARISSDSS